MPISERSASTSVLASCTETSRTKTRPPDASSSPFRHLRKVLLPDPDGPITQTTSEALTVQSIPRSTANLPNCLVRPSTRITSSISSLQFLHDVGQAQRQHPVHERNRQVRLPIA